MLIQQIVNGLLLGSMYALVAIGYTLTFGVLRILNLAHGEVFMLGGLVGLGLAAGLHLPFPLVLVGAALAAGVASIAVEYLCVRPAKGDPLGPVLGTIGIGIILTSVAVKVIGSEPAILPVHLAAWDVQLGPLLISWVQVVILGISVLLMVGLYLLIMRTRFGRALRALAENSIAAQMQGIDVARLRLLTFFISGLLAGASGILVALRLGMVSPFVGASVGMKALAAMVVGGLGSLPGAMAAGLLLGTLEVLGVAYGSAAYSEAVVWAVLLMVLLVRPNGLFKTA